MQGHSAQDDHRARDGYLVIADISGYTAFLTGSELDHASSIISELTSLIRSQLTPPMHFVKLEGDAVFCYAGSSTFPNGERFIELIEACYFAYSNRLSDMARSTTCPCTACTAISSLGLKFVTHYGTFVVEESGGRTDLTGADVILVHRLLKNTIADTGGVKAYAFVTEACMQRFPSSVDLPIHQETYEAFGDVRGGVHDLAPVLSTMLAARREFVDATEADFEMTFDLPVPPPLAWDYFVDPLQRQRWACVHFGTKPDPVAPNEHGRTGVGSTMHCSHGPGTWFREYLDWRPFDYLTCRTAAPLVGRFIGPRSELETVEFIPTDAGTKISFRSRLLDRSRVSLVTFRLQRKLYEAEWRRWHAALRLVAEEDAASFRADDGV